MLHRLAALLAVLLAVLISAPALADDDREVAAAQFKEAKRLYDDENYQPALKLFELAWQFSHSPNARLYIGKCHLKLQQYEQAYNELSGTLQDAAATGEDKYDSTRQAAAAEIALIEPKVGRVLIVLADPDRATEVKVAGEPFDALGQPVAVPTGNLQVEATSNGEQVSRTANIVAGKTASVAVYFPPKGEDGPGDQPGPAQPVSRGFTGIQIGGFVALGIGGAALVAGGVLGGLAAGKFQSLEDACGDTACTDPAFADVVDSGKTFELISYIALGVGGAAVLTGGALVLFGGESATDEQATLDVAPLPGGGALMLQGRF